MIISQEQSKRIQVIRGIAIIAVVLIHTCPYGMIQVICRPMVNFCVATFSFLSGMLTGRGGGVFGGEEFQNS